jgi:serine/threonine protein kinase
MYKKIAYTERADIWSVGVTMYTLLTGRYPFDYAGREPVDVIDDRLPRLKELGRGAGQTHSAREPGPQDHSKRNIETGLVRGHGNRTASNRAGRRCRGNAVLRKRSVLGARTPEKLLATGWLLFEKCCGRYQVKSAAPEESVAPSCKLWHFRRDLKNPFELHR